MLCLFNWANINSSKFSGSIISVIFVVFLITYEQQCQAMTDAVCEKHFYKLKIIKALHQKCDMILSNMWLISYHYSHLTTLPDVVVTVVLVLGVAESQGIGPDSMLQSLSPVSRMEQVCELWLKENIWPPYTGPSSCRNSWHWEASVMASLCQRTLPRKSQFSWTMAFLPLHVSEFWHMQSLKSGSGPAMMESHEVM